MTSKLSKRAVGCSVNRCIGFIIDWILGFIPCYFFWRDAIRDGQSFGKAAMGLRVVKVNGGSPGCIDSCLRNFCMLPPCGWICILFNDEKRHLGDLIAGTMVIEDS